MKPPARSSPHGESIEILLYEELSRDGEQDEQEDRFMRGQYAQWILEGSSSYECDVLMAIWFKEVLDYCKNPESARSSYSEAIEACYAIVGLEQAVKRGVRPLSMPVIGKVQKWQVADNGNGGNAVGKL